MSGDWRQACDDPYVTAHQPGRRVSDATAGRGGDNASTYERRAETRAGRDMRDNSHPRGPKFE